MNELRGRTAIVTGASRGLGAVVARALAREGVNLVLAARSIDALQELANELATFGVRTLPVATDMQDEQQLRTLVDTTLREFGSIDLLINNAGIEAFRPYHLIDTADIVQTIHVNLIGTLLLTRFVLPHMLQAGRGHIVNMASTAGKYGPAYGAAYGASKAGMIAFTQSLRGELYKTGVSASAICPGFAHDGGIYEVIKERTGRGTPLILGSTSAEAVARAVIRVIRRDKPEAVVNIPALRPVFVICQAFPRLGEWIVRQATRRYLKLASQREGDQPSKRR